VYRAPFCHIFVDRLPKSGTLKAQQNAFRGGQYYGRKNDPAYFYEERSSCGCSRQGGQYGDMFQAFVGEAKLKQVSPAGTFFVSDTLLGKPFATEEKDLRLNFPDAEIKEAYRNGQPAVLKIVINGISETLFLVKKNGGYAATKTLPSLTTV
jgi:hypothetical protein